jgi:hypothetical protein
MRIKLIFIFLFIGFSALAEEEFILSKSIVNAYTACFNFKLEDARSFLIEDRVVNKNNAFRYLIENYIDAINLLVEDDPIFYKVALSKRLKRLEALSECNRESVFYNYVLSDVHLQWAFVRIKFGDQVKAVNELRLAAKYNKLNKLKFPTFILNDKNDAVIQAIASSIPPKFAWIGRQLNIEGKIESATAKIEEFLLFTRINRQFYFLQPELNLIKLFIEFNLSSNLIESSDLSKYLDDKEFDSDILKFYLSINLIKNGQNSTALNLLNEISNNKNGIEFNYLNYLKAEINLNTKLNDANYFDVFLVKYKGSSYIKSALRKKAWMAILSNNIDQYKFLMNKLLIEGFENTDDDKQAMMEAKSKLIPNLHLLSARLYFDGGEYNLSLNQLSLIDIKLLRIDEKSEFYYRRGRCFQRLKKLENAQSDFNSAIAISRFSNAYIQAVACFNQAQIYEQLHNKVQSEKFYKMVLETKQHPYKMSLDAKSKSAIQRFNSRN